MAEQLERGCAQDERPKCAVCEAELSFRWTDTHGVGVCTTCGAPYTIYHYDGDKRLDKPPEIALKGSGVEIARRYWSECKRWAFPGCFDMGILRSRGGRTYSGATDEDMRLFDDWYKQNIPAQPQEGE